MLGELPQRLFLLPFAPFRVHDDDALLPHHLHAEHPIPRDDDGLLPQQFGLLHGVVQSAPPLNRGPSDFGDAGYPELQPIYGQDSSLPYRIPYQNVVA